MIGETAKTSQALARERDVGHPAQPVAAATTASEENAAARTDLLAVVAEHVETFKSHAPAAVEVTAHGDLELCTHSQRIAAERVLRESLSNIAKHAGAANVTIQ